MRGRNSTIRVKKRQLDCGCFDYAFSKNRCKAHATQYSIKKKDEEEQDSIEWESFNNLVDDLDAVFSQLVRLKAADKDGMAYCYTSGARMRWQELQCGHFIPRRHYATRWLEMNARPQSQHDNCFLHGNLKMFEERLEEEKPGTVEYLRELSREVYKPTITDLKQHLSELRYKLSLVKKKI